jgi:class 3 adenylate cyclase
VPVVRSFVIVDLAGFSAATEAHGDEMAADLAGRLVALTRRSLGPGDELVKSLGDAVLCACIDGQSAVALLSSLFVAADDEVDFPLLRAGAHAGTATLRDGDWFGTGVNVASRVVGLAAGGQIIVTDAVASAARDLGFEVVELGSFELRNIPGELVLFELEVGGDRHGSAVDPVCQMRVSRDRAAGHLRHGGVEYVFFSLICAASFAADPGAFVPNG